MNSIANNAAYQLPPHPASSLPCLSNGPPAINADNTSQYKKPIDPQHPPFSPPQTEGKQSTHG